ncbi:hypothetical protein O6H91_18G010000 [Diphasiastrum complanatum]|uniref:Uncharacterized protein n=1 Tax=Diphasiastrum complanatum TaxID=34168 RepID=A0ACC2AY28_DIPCM|nr:hypothetical protein O6H91_18G010000 [Diphasiastrum complanatum]
MRASTAIAQETLTRKLQCGECGEAFDRRSSKASSHTCNSNAMQLHRCSRSMAMCYAKHVCSLIFICLIPSSAEPSISASMSHWIVCPPRPYTQQFSLRCTEASSGSPAKRLLVAAVNSPLSSEDRNGEADPVYPG